jgi:hypothetical protein
MGNARTSEETKPNRHQPNHHDRPKIRLDQDQSAQQPEHDQGRQQTLAKRRDLVFFSGQIGCHINDDHQLDQFRRLHRDRPKP